LRSFWLKSERSLTGSLCLNKNNGFNYVVCYDINFPYIASSSPVDHSGDEFDS
jgi:hypothetical protein